MEDGAGSEVEVLDSAEEVDLDVVAVGDQETVSEAEEDSVMAEGLEEADSVVATASAEAGAALEVGTEDSAVVEEDLEAEMEDSEGVEEAEEVSAAVVSAEVCT